MFCDDFFDATLNISLAALKQNYQLLKNQAAPAECAATVKANAYGLGIDEIAPALYEAGCRNFYVATLGEAIHLRHLLPDVTIYVFHGVKPHETEAFLKFNLVPVINNFSQVELWLEFSKAQNIRLPANLHFDTGINRLGLSADLAKDLGNHAELKQHIELKFIMSHLACANEHDNVRNQQQLDKFKTICQSFPGQKFSLANSSAIFLDKEYHFDQVRPGAALFGINPTPYLKTNPMQRVVNLSTKIIHLQQVTEDGMVGYGNMCPVKSGMRLAVIPIGYADGYLRSLTNRGYCYLNGKIIPTLGKISMDMTVIDISSFNEAEVKIGDEVEIIGEHINLSDLAAQAGTIAYEILTSFSSRFKKIYS